MILLPFRLLYAVFQYLSFFTARYTGRPLTTAGGPERTGADARRMMAWSNLIEAEHAAGQEEPAPSVPRSWQLQRLRPDGASETVAEGVLAYDIRPEGDIVYTTGSAIHLLLVSGERLRVVTHGRVSAVAFAG
jgi:hypothetical protein